MKNINLESQARLFQGIPTNFVSTELLPGEKILVTWNKFPFTTSFEKYKVMGLEEDVEINSANDTTLIDESPPLGRGTYILSVFSKDEQETPKVFIKGKHIGTPFEFSEHAMLKYIPEKNIFIKINYSFTTNIQSISTYDGNSMSLIQHRDLSNSVDISQFAISDNGDYIYYAYDRKVYKINISTLITESETDIISLLPPGNYRTLSPIYSIKVNNNNKLAALIVKNNNLQMLSFFDMNSKQFLNAFHFNFGNYYEDMKITDDQQYIAFNDRIFKRLGSTLTEIGSTNTTTAAFTKDYSSIIVAMNDRIQILRISDMQLQFEIPGTFYFAPSVDLRSGLFGVNGYIFDPSTGQQRGRIRVAGLRHFYQNGLYFVDGYYKYVILN